MDPESDTDCILVQGIDEAKNASNIWSQVDMFTYRCEWTENQDYSVTY